MNFNKVELIGGERQAVHVCGQVTFKTKTLVEVPIACIPRVNTDKEVKKIIKDFKEKIKTGLFGSPLAIMQPQKKDYACKIIDVSPLVIDDNLVIIGKIKMLDTKYGGIIIRGLKHPIVKVYFGPIYEKGANGKLTLSAIEVES